MADLIGAQCGAVIGLQSVVDIRGVYVVYALLDPSADEQGVTVKLGIDATRPLGDPFAEKLVMRPEKMAWARALVERHMEGLERPPSP